MRNFLLHTLAMVSGGKQSGFTLIELMVVIAIAALAITLSTPLSNIYKRNRVTTQVHDFVAALKLARSEAITRGNPVSVCVAAKSNPTTCRTTSNNGGSGTWEDGWIVFSDLDGSCSITNSNDVIINQHRPLSENYTLRKGNSRCIQYNANGVIPIGFGVLTLCDPTKSQLLKRGIDLSISGRVQILDTDSAKTQSVTLDSCPAT